MKLTIRGNIIDIFGKKIFPAEVTVENGKIAALTKIKKAPEVYLLPGFVDAHVHVESSMLIPTEFARLAVVHGTVSTVSDPHEIANVLGRKGVEFMIENGNKVNFKFNFGAPSCVPATSFETAGSNIGLDDLIHLFREKKLKYLAEMMNWPGVLQQDESVMAKIRLAQNFGLPVDGHAPGLMDEAAETYFKAGISTDHECFTTAEALHKLKLGMKILVREGSAAKNFEALHPLLHVYPDQMMFCSDDKHPDDLVEGHINELVKRALKKDVELFKVLKIACVNPVKHYGLEVGLLQVNDPADFIVVDSLVDFNILQTWINGELVAENGKSLISSPAEKPVNYFQAEKVQAEDFLLPAESSTIRVIDVRDGELITGSSTHEISGRKWAEADPLNDVLKIAVVNRYQVQKPAIAFVRNFGIRSGAIASSVAHDSHNIIAVGVSDQALAAAVNLVIGQKGGVSAAMEGEEKILPLPVAGLMSLDDGYKVAQQYQEIDKFVKDKGCKLKSPFMTLSFLALLVIPRLKLSDLGLFNAESFRFESVFIK